jgi:hypothetical protein
MRPLKALSFYYKPPVYVQVTQVDVNLNYFIGDIVDIAGAPISHMYPPAGPTASFIAFIEDCCWITNGVTTGPVPEWHNNNPFASQRLETIVWPGVIASSYVQPLVHYFVCAIGSTCTMPIGAWPAATTPVMYRFATPAEASGTGFNPLPGSFFLNPVSGSLSWTAPMSLPHAPAMANLDWYSVALMADKVIPGLPIQTKTPIQVLILLCDPWAPSPSWIPSGCLAGPPSTEFRFASAGSFAPCYFSPDHCTFFAPPTPAWPCGVAASTQTFGIVSHGLWLGQPSGRSACFNGLTWSLLPDAAVARWQAAGAGYSFPDPGPGWQFSSRYFVVGGRGPACTGWATLCDDVEMLDLRLLTWSIAPQLQVPVAHPAAVVSDGKLITTGGLECFSPGPCQVGSTVQVMDLNTMGGWTIAATMPSPRAGHAIATFQGSPVATGSCLVYVIGGFDGVATLPSVDEYDACTDSWTTPGTIPPMPLAAAHALATMTPAAICVIGGTDNGSIVSFAQRYDFALGSWAVTPVPTARAALASSQGTGGLTLADGPLDPLVTEYFCS